MKTEPKSPENPAKAPQPAPLQRDEANTPPQTPQMPKEIGGRRGPEPTRYGDWENGGKCVDF